MVVSAPTGSGKTGVMELALLRMLSKHLIPAAGEHGGAVAGGVLRPLRGTCKAVYVAPLRALVQERCKDWQARFGALLGLSVLELTGDSEPETSALEAADLLATTPEKLDALSRKLSEHNKSATFLSDISLLLIDEVHLLNESERGSALEAGVVSRLLTLSAFPELREHAISRLRLVAVSATIPNVRDIATWLRVPPEGLKVYGEEMRPVKLRTVVRSYAPSKNDFLFERRLDGFLAGILAEHSKGKPALVFCRGNAGGQGPSRSGPGASAARAPNFAYVRDAAHRERLAAAVRELASGKGEAGKLQVCLQSGVGFHHGGMETAHRELVERLFLAGDLPMVGRAGRPQFDTEGVAVIMTQQETYDRYKNLLSGSEPVESCLADCFAEHLNAEVQPSAVVVLSTVRDMDTAMQWLRTTFFYVRVRQVPRRYGLDPPSGALTSNEAFDRWLTGRMIGTALEQLSQIGLVSQDAASGSLRALEPGRIMAHSYLRMGTMRAITEVGPHAGMMSLLRVIAVAEEFEGHIRLRRTEKRVLVDINKRVEGEGAIKYPLPADGPPPGAAGGRGGNRAPKPKDRLTKPTEKIFIMINEALSDSPGDTLDSSMRQELEGVLRVGQRIAAAMARYFGHCQALAATANSLCLIKSLKQRMWDDSPQAARQLPDIGRLLAQRLAVAGLGALRQLAAADPRRIEAVTQKAYPFGNTVRSHLARKLPPLRRDTALQEVRLTLKPVQPSQQHPHPQQLMVEVELGSTDDRLIRHERLMIETFASPYRAGADRRSIPEAKSVANKRTATNRGAGKQDIGLTMSGFSLAGAKHVPAFARMLARAPKQLVPGDADEMPAKESEADAKAQPDAADANPEEDYSAGAYGIADHDEEFAGEAAAAGGAMGLSADRGGAADGRTGAASLFDFLLSSDNGANGGTADGNTRDTAYSATSGPGGSGAMRHAPRQQRLGRLAAGRERELV
ncbi:hypothetical protein GPECTOR_34g696 [Gonium pectorale]|uniref:Helicase ATP-binding domain-containing protein n=1 Tax=Gonium pectorale TaxID=33097 RepID=A0A150GCG1_GONPE|nr:hypothetical protein GPECTOR_34g696 [Gonium pectorale]|eukprot:KXZ47537.1 hypothetical protein GPECTOR_34g696 [Gonium pectorale]